MIYQKHPFTALRARQRVVSDFEWLTGRTSKTVIAAHSLGSILAVDALGATKQKCDQLWTFGSAIKLLRHDRSSLVRGLKAAQANMRWSNFYDSMDLISGPIGPCEEISGFPRLDAYFGAKHLERRSDPAGLVSPAITRQVLSVAAVKGRRALKYVGNHQQAIKRIGVRRASDLGQPA